jgi:hypothetical protein
MGRLVGRLVFVLVLAAPSRVSAAHAQVTDHGGNSPGVHVQGSPRVRASSPAIAKAIEQALEQSPTFKQLVTAMTATDGIVYVHHGECGRSVRACLLLGVTQAGPNRILHIKVDRRRRGRDLMVAIGHELSHAVELLNEPTVIDATTAQNYYRRNAAIDRYSFETEEAIEIELKIDKELRQWARRQ